MSNLEASYKLILIELRKIAEFENMYFKPIKPKLSDIELISLMILAEFKSIDSEHQLFIFVCEKHAFPLQTDWIAYKGKVRFRTTNVFLNFKRTVLEAPWTDFDNCWCFRKL